MRNYQERNKFADMLAEAWRKELKDGYDSTDKYDRWEPRLVKRLCRVSSKHSVGTLTVNAQYIHGSKVEFLEKQKCELGDMAVISRVINNGTIEHQRISIIQNKNIGEGKDICSIDKTQMTLLHYLPTFEGKGKLKGKFTIHDPFGDFSAYGFLLSPDKFGGKHGEMIFVKARIVDYLSHSDDKVTLDALNSLEKLENSLLGHISMCLYRVHSYHPESVILYTRPTEHESNIPDFIKSWINFNVGKLVKHDENILDDDANSLANQLVKLAEKPNKGKPDNSDDTSGMGVFVLTINLDENRKD